MSARPPALLRPQREEEIAGVSAEERVDTSRVLGETLEALLDALATERGSPWAAEAVSRVVVEQGHRMLTNTDCFVAAPLPDRPDTYRVLAAAGPVAERLLDIGLSVAGTLIEHAIRERRAVEAEAGTLALGVDAGAVPVDTACLLPLLAPSDDSVLGGVMGVLAFLRRRGEPFTEPERHVMDVYARLVGVELHRSVVHAEMAAKASALRTGLDVATDIAESLDMHDVARRLLSRAVAAVRADRATLCRLQGENFVVDASFDVEREARWIGSPYAISHYPVAERVVRTGRPEFSLRPETELLPPPLVEVLSGATHSVMVPLFLNGEVSAVLMMARRAGRPFTGDDIGLLQLIGNVAVLALRNAALYSEAEEASNAKGALITMAAHELRTPLSVVSGYISMLEEGTFGTVPDTWRRPMSILGGKARELSGLIEDLLTTARLDSGAMVTEVRAVDVRDIVIAAIARAEGRSTMLQAELACDLPDMPTPVACDPGQVGHILDNLVNNAMTYSIGRPWVRVSVSGGDPVRVVVEDRGVGIGSPMHERVFDRFARLDDAALPPRPGTGLGLSIARDLAVRNGGRLLLEASRPGHGSRFGLTLPATAGEASS